MVHIYFSDILVMKNKERTNEEMKNKLEYFSLIGFAFNPVLH